MTGFETQISPQAWGCTGTWLYFRLPRRNLPTSVGMYRKCDHIQHPCNKSPHKRGDVPHHITIMARRFAISPQAWGCTFIRSIMPKKNVNLPTSVGMYRGVAGV